MKKLFTLITLCLFTVMSAMAELTPTVVVNCDFEDSENLFNNASRITASNVANEDLGTGNHVQKFVTAGNSTNGYSSSVYSFGDLTKNAAAVKIEFDYYIVNANCNYDVAFIIRDAAVAAGHGKTTMGTAGAFLSFGRTRQSSTNYFSINRGKTTGASASNLGLWCHAYVYIDAVNKKVDYTITNKSTSDVIKSETGKAYFNSGASAVSQIDFFSCVNNESAYLDNLVITSYKDESATTAAYRVNWVDANDLTIKTTEREGNVGSQIELAATDKNSLFDAGDATKKYIYVSDDVEGKKITEDGKTVVTIKMRDAVKYSYTITSSYNSEALDFTASGSTWEDEPTIYVNYPRFQTAGANNNILVEKAPVNNELKTSFNVTTNAFTADIAYTATGIENIYLLSEAENLGTGLSTNGTAFTDRVSNKAIIYGASGTLVNLPAGKYMFTLGMIGGDNSTHKVNYTVSAGEQQIIEASCNGNMLYCKTSEEFTLIAPTAITFTCSDPSSSRGIDLIYVQKTGEASMDITLNAEGFATFSAAFPAKIENANVWTAVIDGNKIVATKVENGLVPAGTGVLVSKNQDSAEGVKAVYDATAPASLDNNNLVATTNADGSLAEVQNKALVLSGSTFKTYTGAALAANKAYFEYAENLSKPMAIVYDGGATATDAIVEEQKELNGKFIQNGKLVIINGAKKTSVAGYEMK